MAKSNIQLNGVDNGENNNENNDNQYESLENMKNEKIEENQSASIERKCLENGSERKWRNTNCENKRNGIENKSGCAIDVKMAS
jgi:hypothetical protein